MKYKIPKQNTFCETDYILTYKQRPPNNQRGKAFARQRSALNTVTDVGTGVFRVVRSEVITRDRPS